MRHKLTIGCLLVGLMLLLLAPALAQEEEVPEGGEEYPPECVDDPSVCEDWTTIEEWDAADEEVPAGGEEYTDECVEDPSLCVDWTTIEEWNDIQEAPAGGEEYPAECIEDPSLCEGWMTIEEWTAMQDASETVEESTDSSETYVEYQSTGVACPAEMDWSNYAEVRVIQMRAGYSYVATVVGIGDFDPVLSVMDQGGNALCIDDEPNASGFSVTLPTTDEVAASDYSAQITFSNNSGAEFADISLYVTDLSAGSGEFVLVVEGMAATNSDYAGDPFAVYITPGMVASDIQPTVYMIGATSALDPYIELIDSNHVTMQDTEGNWILCDDAGGGNCWGYSADLSETVYISSNIYGAWIGGSRDAMLSVPLAEGYDGSYYTFLMKTFNQASQGDYAAAFHIGL